MRGWRQFGAGLCCGVMIWAVLGRGAVEAAPLGHERPAPRAIESAPVAVAGVIAPPVTQPEAQRELVAQTASAAPSHVPESRPPRRERGVGRTLREVFVVDDHEAALPGVTVGTDLRFRSDGEVFVDGGRVVVTDGAGRAELPFADGELVHFFAPGRRLVSQFAPESREPWTVVLRGALRLDVQVVGALDFRGMFVRVEFACQKDALHFWQSKYEQTAGRAVDGTVGRWQSSGGSWRRDAPLRATWELGLSATGSAALDQLEVDGSEVSVQLLRFGRVLDGCTLSGEQLIRPVRLTFVAPPLPPLAGVVVDAAGRAIAGARLRMAPHGGSRIVDSPCRGQPFPVWAPDVRADFAGRFSLPRAEDGGERIVVTCDGHAARVVTIAELEAAAGRIVMQPGRTVRTEILDCNGKPLEGGFTTGGHDYEEPSVLIGHDVWRGTSDRELPWFEWPELPSGVVTFRCAGQTWRHDVSVPVARFVTGDPVESMNIGK